MTPRSISRRLITAVLVLELVSALALVAITAIHESHIRLRAFDITIRAHAYSLIGSVGDAEDKGDHLVLNTASIKPPPQDIFQVTDEETATVLGHSAQWPDPQVKAAVIGNHGVYNLQVDGKAYRLARAQNVRIIDPDQPGGGIVHHVTALYGAPTQHLWQEVWETVRFYTLASFLLLALTGCGMAWYLRLQLAPLRQLAAEAARVSARQWHFSPPESARATRELAPLTQAIEATLLRLQASFEQQERFTSDAAHELKTDVAIAKSSLQLLAMRSRSVEEYKQGLAVCLKDSARLENTVQQMLALARVQHASPDPATLPSQAVTLDLNAHAAIDKFASLAELRRVAIHLSTTPNATVRLDARDADLLCSNLLLNALQHSPPGSAVAIEISSSAAIITLSITDSGEGILPDILPHVFEPFFRGDPSRSRHTGGTGLGLSICKAICDRAGGNIGIESTPGAGTRVTVSLPAHTGPSAVGSATENQHPFSVT